MDIFRFTETAEAGQPILNPFTAEQLALLGRLCRLRPDQTILDLGCGKGELLCTWARDHGTEGIGVDIFAPLIADAERRAIELCVDDRVTFVTGDAGTYDPGDRHFDVVACIGAAWVGGSLSQTLALMRRHAADDDSLLLVGEPFRRDEATTADDRRTLAGLLDVFEESRLDLVEMVIASHESWDRYRARKWWTADRWLHDNPSSPEAPEVRQHLDSSRRKYLEGERSSQRWGVFVLRPR